MRVTKLPGIWLIIGSLFLASSGIAHAAVRAEAAVFQTSTSVSQNSVTSLTDDSNVSQTDYVNASYDATHGIVIPASEGTYSVGFGSYVPENYTGPGTMYLHRVLITNQDGVTVLDESFDGWSQDSTSTEGSETRSEYSTDSGIIWATYADTTDFYTGGGSAFEAVNSGGDNGMVYPFDGGGPFSVLIRTLVTAPQDTTELRINLDWRYNVNIFAGGEPRVFSVGLQSGEVDPEFLFSFSAPANVAPVITSTAVTSVDEDSLYTYTLTATDSDVDDTLTFSGQTIPSWLEFDPETGVLSGTPANENVGPHNVTLQVSDGTADVEQSFTITVNNTNDSPTGNVSISGFATEEQTLTANTDTIADDDGLGAFSYQWRRDGSPIADATSATYVTLTSDIGSILTLVVSYTDQQGAEESLTSAAFGPIKADLDRDGIADDTDPDIDGDGMSNEYENEYGLDPRDLADASTDLDSDGSSNLEEFNNSTNPTVDDIAPVFSDLPLVTVDAAGLFTTPALDAPVAVDGKDGEIVATYSGTPLKPGAYTITWMAEDQAGNQATAEQTLHIRPLVNFEIDQLAEEGGEVDVRVVLNGNAPIYPLTASYSVSGTAESEDHDATDGIVTIAEGLEGTISFTLIDDEIIGEAGETVVFTLDEITNGVAGNKTTHTVTLVETNQAPSASLSVVQANETQLLIDRSAGSVTVTSQVSDPNPNDTHSYDWSGSDNSLIDTDNDSTDNTFVFDPVALAPGVYTLVVTVTDSGNPSLQSTASVEVNVLQDALVLEEDVDSDGDGIDDSVEGAGDEDGDRVPDYLDAINISNIIQTQTGTNNEFLMETNPGLSLRLGKTAFSALIHSTGLNEDEFLQHSNDGMLDYYTTFYSQIYDFEVSGLARTGATVDVVLPLEDAIPADAIYRKFSEATGWNDFVENARNTLKSAPGQSGFCPSVGDNRYTSGLTEGHYCVLVSIEDGGPNDADGTANGQVVDPGAIAVAKPETEVNVKGGSSGGSMEWFFLIALLSVSLLSRYRTALLTLVFASGVSNASQAAAGNEVLSSLYFTVNAGQADTELSPSRIESELAAKGITASASELDTERTGWALGIGYLFSDNLALEISYLDLQDVEYTLTTIDTVSDSDVADVRPDSGDGAHISLLYRHPITDQWDVRARGGAFSWRADYDAKVLGGGKVDTSNESGVDLMWGLGTAYQLLPQWSVSFEYQRFEFDYASTDFYAVGVQWWPKGD